MWSNCMTELYNEKTVKIRKPHQCCVCLRKIPKGFKCIHHSGKTEDGFFNYYTCNTCHTIVNEYPNACKTCLEKIYSLGMFYKFQEKTLQKGAEKGRKKKKILIQKKKIRK